MVLGEVVVVVHGDVVALAPQLDVLVEHVQAVGAGCALAKGGEEVVVVGAQAVAQLLVAGVGMASIAKVGLHVAQAVQEVQGWGEVERLATAFNVYVGDVLVYLGLLELLQYVGVEVALGWRGGFLAYARGQAEDQ